MITINLRSLWDNLHKRANIPSPGIQYQAFYDCPFGQIHISSDEVGNEALYISLDADSASKFQSPTVGGLRFDIVTVKALSASRPFLKISINQGYDDIKEAFESFTITLTGRLSTISSCLEALDEIYSVCDSYYKFFSRHCETTIEPKKEQGLFAELVVLSNLIDRHGDEAVNHWYGPESSRHDFVFSKNAAIEVKSCLSLAKKTITISNDAQLVNINNAPLYLVVVWLERNRGIKTSELIEKIYEKLSSQSSKKLFEDKLLECQVNRNNFSNARNFGVREMHFYLVDEKFPKLTQNYVNSISSRIFDVKYKIDLEGYPESGDDVYGLI